MGRLILCRGIEDCSPIYPTRKIVLGGREKEGEIFKYCVMCKKNKVSGKERRKRDEFPDNQLLSVIQRRVNLNPKKL